MSSEERLSDLMDALPRILEGTGVEVRFSGPTAILEIDGRTLQRPWRAVRRTPLGDRDLVLLPEPALLLMASRLTEAAARDTRGRGHWYVDVHGNAYIRAPGVLVDVRGRRPERVLHGSLGAPETRGTNLMSARRAQVIFALLTWPELLNAPLRLLAETAGVSVSLAHNTTSALEEEGYLIPGAGSLDRRDLLIDQWAAAFPMGLAKALELGRFAGEPTLDAWPENGGEAYVSGEQATGLIRGGGLTLYVPALDSEILWRHRWRRATPGEPESIVIRKKFWAAPWTAREWGQHLHPGLETAPPLLVYADLLSARDPRQREVAEEYRRDILGSEPR